ncbi:MAG: bifunctional 4-hydroxy-2-oxoglutarate aldolase/2-dehydro-3-deoxy-phosphogluconate aldolase [Planctomycetota bacterium]
MPESTIAAALVDAGAVAVVRLKDASIIDPVVDALLAGGVRAIEITMTMPNAIDVIRGLAARGDDRLLIGVGSVLDGPTATQAVGAGARYVVSPIFVPAVIDATRDAGAAPIPGAATPTEIHEAHGSGAAIVKVFPADVVGMPFFKAVLAPMPHLQLMPTGGVTCENAGDWIRSGAVAVGIGSALLNADALARRDFEEITRRAEVLCDSIRSARS